MKKEFQKLARKMLDKAKQNLIKDKSLHPVIGILSDDGDFELLPLPGEAMNDSRLKDLVFALVAAQVKERKAQVVFFITDSYVLKMSKQQQKRLAKIDIDLNMNLTEMAAAGYGEKVEAITVTAQTPEETQVLSAEYARASDGTIEFFETLIHQPIPNNNVEGRAATFFR
jgi:dsRNA-specific ribonuclease